MLRLFSAAVTGTANLLPLREVKPISAVGSPSSLAMPTKRVLPTPPGDHTDTALRDRREGPSAADH